MPWFDVEITPPPIDTPIEIELEDLVHGGTAKTLGVLHEGDWIVMSHDKPVWLGTVWTVIRWTWAKNTKAD